MENKRVFSFNALTGEEKYRDMTEDEIIEFKQYEIQRAEYQESLRAKEAERQALLAKLGITEEEAKLLLG